MWTILATFFGRVFAALTSIWLVRQDAKKDAKTELALEVSKNDRKEANQIRDRVDAVKHNGVRSKPNDNRGYRD